MIVRISGGLGPFMTGHAKFRSLGIERERNVKRESASSFENVTSPPPDTPPPFDTRSTARGLRKRPLLRCVSISWRHSTVSHLQNLPNSHSDNFYGFRSFISRSFPNCRIRLTGIAFLFYSDSVRRESSKCSLEEIFEAIQRMCGYKRDNRLA